MTEEEAKTKWCPMVRESISPVDDTSINRDVGDCHYNCIASDCAMWVKDLDLINPECRGNILIECRYKESDTEGHCGLINK